MIPNRKIQTPELVVMLTHNDFTVENAEEVFDQCKDSEALFWGMKEKPLSLERMKSLFTSIKEAGKKSVLEVVAYDEENGLKGARLAAECGCDILMGTKFYESIMDFCKSENIAYMPFVGNIKGRPSVLKGSIDDILAEAGDVISRGASGVDLLGYRYEGDAALLNRILAKKYPGKVCIAGSIDSYDRLDEIIEAAPDSFTIGSAFFNNKFGEGLCEQINNVCHYLKNPVM